VKSYSSAITLQYDSIAYNRRSDGSDWAVDAAGATVNAASTWWGSTSGPEVSGQSVTGGGSKVSTSVTTTSWLGSAFETDHKRGNLPWTVKAGEGADVASGNFVFTEEDFSIPTIGYPLEAVRTYNNQTAATVTGDFGYGWTWTYGTNLNTAADANGGVTWEQPDGAKNYFKKNPGDGSFTPEQRIYSTLTYDSASLTYTLTHKDQTKWVFNSSGKLISQIDTDGNTTTVARDGTGKITTITEPTGRTLTVLYSGSFISKITDPLGRTYNYAYGTANSITGVTKKEPDGTTVFNTCSYTYTGSVTAMTSLTDCDGNVLTQTFDASKRVTTQTWNGSTPSTRFVYGPATDAPDRSHVPAVQHRRLRRVREGACLLLHKGEQGHRALAGEADYLGHVLLVQRGPLELRLLRDLVLPRHRREDDQLHAGLEHRQSAHRNRAGEPDDDQDVRRLQQRLERHGQPKPGDRVRVRRGAAPDEDHRSPLARDHDHLHGRGPAGHRDGCAREGDPFRVRHQRISLHGHERGG